MSQPATDTDLGAESLEGLAGRLRASDAAAYTELFDRLREPLFAYARTVTPEADAYDVLQDVFLKLWEDRARLEVRVGVGPLLFRMVRNRALNRVRKMKRVRLPGDLPDRAGDGSPEQRMEDRALGERVAGWMAKLPPRRAEAFSLSRYHDLSHAEIARIMGLSVRTVQTHIVHALRDLRASLEAWEAEQHLESSGRREP